MPMDNKAYLDFLLGLSGEEENNPFASFDPNYSSGDPNNMGPAFASAPTVAKPAKAAPVAAQSGQVAQNAQKPMLGVPAPLPAPIPPPVPVEAQGGLPAAPPDALPVPPQPPPPALPVAGPPLEDLAKTQVVQNPANPLQPQFVTPTEGNLAKQAALGASPSPAVSTPVGPINASDPFVEAVNQKLLSQYGPALAEAKAARESDLNRMRTEGVARSRYLYNQAVARGETPSELTIAGQLAPYTTAQELDTLQKAVETSSKMLEAQIKQSSFDPDSPLQRASFVSLISSPEFEGMVQSMAKSFNQDPNTVRTQAYNWFKKMPSLAIEMLRAGQKQGISFDKENIGRLMDAARTREQEIKNIGFINETMNDAAIKMAKMDATSHTSAITREIVRFLLPALKDDKRLDKMNSFEMEQGFLKGNLSEHYANLMRWRVETARESYKQQYGTAVPWLRRSQVPTSGLFPGEAPNINTGGPTNEQTRSLILNGAKGIDAAGDLVESLSKHNPLIVAGKVKFDSPQGRDIQTNFLQLAASDTGNDPELSSAVGNVRQALAQAKGGDVETLKPLWRDGTGINIATKSARQLGLSASRIVSGQEDIYHSNPLRDTVPSHPPLHLAHSASVEDLSPAKKDRTGLRMVLKFGRYGKYKNLNYVRNNGNWIPYTINDDGKTEYLNKKVFDPFGM